MLLPAFKSCRGLQAGLAAGQEAAEKGEIIETQKGFLSQISIFDQAYNNALSKAYVAGVDNDARENINRLLTDNPDDIEAFDAAVNCVSHRRHAEHSR